MGDQAQEVAPLEAVRGRRRVPGLEGPGLDDARAGRQSVGEDLVEDGIANPSGRIDRHRRRVAPRGPGRRRRRVLPPAAHRGCRADMAQSGAMLQLVRQMPPGVLVLLGYGFLVLAFLGLTMPLVVDQAI